MSNAYIHIRINRNLSVAVLVSVLLHALILLFVSRHNPFDQQSPASEPQTMVVQLNPRHAAPAATPSPVPPPVQPPVLPKVKPTTPRPPPTPHRELAPKVMTVPHADAVTVPPPRNTAAPSQPPALDPSQFPDMASYLAAVREKRGQAASGDASAPSQEDIRAATIKRNLQQSGTNGVFQITSMDAHTATFAFRGWKNESSYSRREFYQVDAGFNGDVRLAVVRKMIEIIRRYYSGDFNWDSPRLGRVVVLSARLQDNDGLEDVLMKEFFGSGDASAR